MAEEILGLKELQRSLNQIQKQLPKTTKEAAGQIAREWISAARNKASRPGARAAAQSLSVGNATDGAAIVNSHPQFFGEEFGGRSRPATMQFPPYVGQRGYWFYPAARERAPDFQKIWEAAVDDATKSWDHKE